MFVRQVLKLLTEQQLLRYEAFRRASLSKRSMKRVGPSPLLAFFATCQGYMDCFC